MAGGGKIGGGGVWGIFVAGDPCALYKPVLLWVLEANLNWQGQSLGRYADGTETYQLQDFR